MFNDKLNCSGSLPIHRLAGNMRMNELIDEYHSIQLSEMNEKNETELKSIRQQVEDLSCQLNILSKFTSLVAVDPTKLDVDPKERVKVTVPLMFRHVGAAKMAMPTGSICYDTFDGTLQICDFNNSLGFDTDMCAEDQFQEIQPVKVMEKHIRLAELQSFSGFWKLNSDLSECFEIPLDNLTEFLKQTEKSLSLSDVTWGTALVIAYLELCMPEKENEWRLIVDKARYWLNTQGQVSQKDSKNPSESCNELIEKARQVLTKLLKPTTSK
ncbi:unnamed protein product [Schistosoma margrebowiei]|uniref:Uncharacterized protein n=1 Tax=Schistosoma margrebowiei TaxID=48269 RepID=A0A3P7ZDI1_9TREM|nr:unnamed protein product [Schistosoma margrebowiei]